MIPLGLSTASGVVAGGVGKLLRDLAFQVGNVDVEGGKNRPQVFPCWPLNQLFPGRRRRLCARAGVEDVLPVGHEVRTSRPPFQRTDCLWFIRTVSCRVFHLHGKNLVALQSPFCIVALEGQPFTVRAPVSFGIVAAEGELADVFQMGLAIRN